MAMYVALLRGINVGGRNLIGMPALKAAFEADGFQDVLTYIQSGNVLFRTSVRGAAAISQRVERMLAKAFDYEASVVIRSHAQMRGVVERAPEGYGTQPATYRYDVAFLKEALTAKAALKELSLREGIDRAWAGRGVLYFSRLDSRATQSRLNKVASLPIYKHMTLRNWNTTTKLLRMMDEAASR